MIVCKFGGSSVADAAQIKKTENIVKSNSDRCIVVVSAPGKRNKQDEKITDLLYACQKLAAAGADFYPVWNKIKGRYLEIASVLGVTSAISSELDIVEKKFAERCTADYAASRGEYLNARLIANYFGFEFIDCADVVRLGERGEILPETYALVAARTDSSKKYVVPGFYGKGPDGNIKTFSRGGSDITGSIFAKAVRADVYENWTDVSGIYTADPRITQNGKPITEITYTEMREMAYLGANVFHEEAIAPAKDAGISINIKNTNRPDDAGTFIRAGRDSSGIPLVGVAGKCGFARITVCKSCGCMKDRLAAYGLSPAFRLDGIDTVNIFVSDPGTVDWKKLESDLNVSCMTGLAVVGVVGQGLGCCCTSAVKILAALQAGGVSVRSFNYGGSAVSAVFSVPETEYEKAVDIVASLI